MSDLSSIMGKIDKSIHSHHDLVSIASKWVKKKLNFPVVATELKNNIYGNQEKRF